MSAVIVSLAAERARRNPAPNRVLSDDAIDDFIFDVFRVRAIDQAERDVAAQLAGMSNARISIAQAHAQRWIRAGVPSAEAMRRALRWARYSFDPFPPSAA